MEEMIFEVGATVRLRSGGPLMVIDSPGSFVKDSRRWNVVWFDKAGVDADMFRADVDERTLVREELKEAP